MPGQGLHIISTLKNLHVTSNSTLGVYSLLLHNNDKNLSKGRGVRQMSTLHFKGEKWVQKRFDDAMIL